MTASRYILMALLFVVSWIMYLDRAAISTAKSAIGRDLALSDESMGLVFGAFALGYALAQIPSGWFADRIGPRTALAAVVFGWSALTALTGAVHSLWAMIAVRFAFGVAEAGAFPGAARVYYSWLPTALHGRANGIVFSGARLGAAFAFPLLAWLIGDFGWRTAFYLLCIPGVLWASVWLLWFRDEPAGFEPEPRAQDPDIPFRRIFASEGLLLAMAQYFAGNFTFFLCLTWMSPYLMQRYKLPPDRAAWYLTAILLIGATAQWIAGASVDALHRSRHRAWSRRLPAIAGYSVSATALAVLPWADDVTPAVALLTVATFGVELAISPSWAYCIDLGGRKSGAVSGSMNMVGNLGSFASASIFPVLYRWTGSAAAYFYCAAALNLIAALIWFRLGPPAAKRAA